MPLSGIVAAALVVGAALGARLPVGSHVDAVALVLLVAAVGARTWGLGRVTLTLLVAACTAVGVWRAHDSAIRAQYPSLRAALDEAFGGFTLDTLGPEGAHPPLLVRMRADEDATVDAFGARLHVHVEQVARAGRWVPVEGGVAVSVSGTPTLSTVREWRAGRHLEAPMTFRRPARYLNPGVPDDERRAALDDTALFGSVKSARLVRVAAGGTSYEEWGAAVRAAVRDVIARGVGPMSTTSASIATALLIGDRTGLPPRLQERLQAGGVYHVLAISGGNIAVFVMLVLGLARLCGASPRLAASCALALLIAYAGVVVAGPSVFRSVLMACVYLGAQLLDHRAPPWHALALAAVVAVMRAPLDVLDAGFQLTFGATLGLLVVGPRVAAWRARGWNRVVHPAAVALATSLAAEVALLPIGATAFGRVTFAGLILNLIALPAMAVAQLAGLALLCLSLWPNLAEMPAWVVHLSARILVESTRLVDVLPWLAHRVATPPLWMSAAYYAALVGVVLRAGWIRWMAAACAVLLATGIVVGVPGVVGGRIDSRSLGLTLFDVGQGESLWIRWPNGRSMLIDTGGAPFGRGNFDIGDRVLTPALWALGARRVDTVLVTHGDPDHIGGAPAVVRTFRPQDVFTGIPVPSNALLHTLDGVAERTGARRRQLVAGDTWAEGEATIRVLHPPMEDWERPRVRNDDSVVLLVRYRAVEILLTGDVGADVERDLVASGALTPPAPGVRRVLKVAHHGSRTSTSAQLLAVWQPSVALISCGRGNRFGHPVPEVIERLAETGAVVYRTDTGGAITLTTDGEAIRVQDTVSGMREVRAP